VSVIQSSTTRQDDKDSPERISELRTTPIMVFRKYLPWFVTVLNLTVFFIVWELFARSEVVSDLFLPRPSDIWAAVVEGFQIGLFQQHLLYSLRNFALGLGLATLVGVPIGLLMGANRVVDSIFSPYVWSMASLPRIALVPLFILILGFSDVMKVSIIFLSAIFPIIINCMAGVKTTDPSLLRAARVFGAGRRQLYTKVVFPFTLPFIISGINQGMTRGLVGLIIAEIFGGNRGLGFLIVRSADTYNSPRLFAVLIMLVIVSLSFVQGIRWVEHKVAPWRREAAL
jgi:ABC-type nitrate/sulfonate/bicarbonate transport system permease component